MKKTTLMFFYFMISFLATTQAQVTSRKLSPYTRSFLTRINQPDVSPTQIKALRKEVGVKQSGSQEYVSTFIYLEENAETQALEQIGVKVNTRIKNIITAQVPSDMLETVAALPEVKYVQMGIPVHRKMDKARITSNVDKVQAGTAPLSGLYFGKDVVVGIIDNGFEYGHPNFYNKDHTEYRVKRVWDQNALVGTPPAGFTYGKELSTQDEILAAKRDTTDTSHGTHVAGIATGADRSNKNTYYGIAGDADIVMVSQTGVDTNVADGIKYIYDYASSVGKPCVINLSLGISVGPHDGTSTFDVIADQLQGKGRLLVGAAGNEGNSKTHISKNFSQTDTIFKTFYGSNNIFCDIWGEIGKNYKVQVCVYDTINKKTIYTSPEYNASKETSDEIRLKKTNTSTTNGANGYLDFYCGINPQTQKPNIFISSTLTSIAANNRLELIIKATEGSVHAWTDAQAYTFTNYNQSGWSDGDRNYSIDEIGGTGKQIISVGAYVSNTSYTDLNNVTYNTDQTLNDLATFSSMGPTVDGRIKPEITAPGSILASSVSNYDTSGTTDRVKASVVDGNTYYYGMMEGTSMSAPYVTGVLATWLQVNPNLTPAEVKSILQKTAINDSSTGNLLPSGNNTWGYGKIDAYNGLLEVIKYTSIEDTSVVPQSILMYATQDNHQLLNFLFTQRDSNIQINVFNVNGQKLQSKKIAEVTSKQEETIDLGNLPKGLYLIKITGDKLNQVFKASTK